MTADRDTRNHCAGDSQHSHVFRTDVEFEAKRGPLRVRVVVLTEASAGTMIASVGRHRGSKPRTGEAALEHRWRRLYADYRHRQWVHNLPVGQIWMYDYDLSKVLRILNLAGIEELKLVSTDHDGHHGVIIFGRKTADPHPH